MRKELLRYQLVPCRQTLGRLLIATESIRRSAVFRAAMRLRRAHDQQLLEELLAESGYRVVRMAGALARLTASSDAQLIAYISKISRGAAIDAADSPLFGPTRRNAARRVKPTDVPIAVEWPDEAFDHWPGVDTPTWSHDRDRGNELHQLAHWAAVTALKLATPEERIAVRQVLTGRTDREVAKALGLKSKSSWSLRRAKLLTGMAPRIVAAADDRMNAIGEKFLGIDWILAASEVNRAVLHEEGQRDAA